MESRGEKLVIDYTCLNLLQIQELDLDIYLFYMRDAFISECSKTKEGLEYLENCWRMNQTKPEREKLRKKYNREGGNDHGNEIN